MIARVFPRRTNASPDDNLAFFGPPPFVFPPDTNIGRVHVSVTFTWDLRKAEWLAKQWEAIAPVDMGGPAFGGRSGDFEPGMYLKRGHVITSRGCPNRCWFCSEWKREGDVRELPIEDGWLVQDSNLLACSDEHILAVFDMLDRNMSKPYPNYPEFRGGLEAKRLKPWHVDLLIKVRTRQMFFAYDEPDDYEPLVAAAGLLFKAGYTRKSHELRCYVLIGYPGDTPAKAEKRLRECLDLGLYPQASLWRNEFGKHEAGWLAFQRRWAKPWFVAKYKDGALSRKNNQGTLF